MSANTARLRVEKLCQRCVVAGRLYCPHPPEKLSKPESVSMPRGTKDQEIENLKRLLAHIGQRLDALKSR